MWLNTGTYSTAILVDNIKVYGPSLEEPPPPTEPKLTGISRIAGDQVSIEWTGTAELQSAVDIVAGPWSAVANAVSPYKTAPSGVAKFYRLKW